VGLGVGRADGRSWGEHRPWVRGHPAGSRMEDELVMILLKFSSFSSTFETAAVFFQTGG